MSSGVMAMVVMRVTAAREHGFEIPPARRSNPSADREARSGCGIMPITLRSRFRMPAISRSEPLGLSEIAEHHAVFGFEFVERALVGEIAAFAVGDRHAQHLALAALPR